MKWPFSLFYISIQKKLIECSGLWLLSFNVKWGLCTISKFCLDILLIVVSYTYYVAQSREPTFFWLWGLPVYNISIHHSVDSLEKFTIPITSLWNHKKSNRNPIKLSKKLFKKKPFIHVINDVAKFSIMSSDYIETERFSKKEKLFNIRCLIENKNYGIMGKFKIPKSFTQNLINETIKSS